MNYNVTIIYQGLAVFSVSIRATDKACAEFEAFSRADSVLADLDRFYNPSEAELYFLNDKRHQVLFQDVA